MKYHIQVKNLVNGDIHEVASFIALGDAVICRNALDANQSSSLEYKIYQDV